MLDQRSEQTNGRVLVLDARHERVADITNKLRILNYEPVTAAPGTYLPDVSADKDIAVVIGDLPGGQSADRALRDFSRKHRRTPVLRVSGGCISANVSKQLDNHHNWEIDSALGATQLDFFLRRARRYRGRERRVRLTGDSVSIKDVRRKIEQVADFDTTVLITGESGTGKELVACTVHDLSGRNDRPFVPVNCGAIPSELLESELFGHEKGAFTGAVNARKGRFELAEGGTLFLDEIGDMSLEMQAKLLRVLQEKTYERVGGSVTKRCDVRIVAATHRNLPERVAAGEFREDLYYRLNVFPIEMPPLRRRVSDLPALLDELLVQHSTDGKPALRLTHGALVALHDYPWPGNIRELSNLVERLAILHPTGKVDLSDLPARYREAAASSGDRWAGPVPTLGGLNLKERLQEIEKQLIDSAMSQSGNVVAEAARLLNVRRTTLVEKINKYQVQD